MTSSLTRAYQSELKRTRQAVADHVERQWRALPEYRDAQVPEFLDKVLPVVKAGQTRAVALTAAYMSKTGGKPPVALDVESLIGAGARNGVDPAQVYARPFTTLWTSIATIGYAAALDKALSRLKSTADMDVALASRNASLAYAKTDDNIIGFERNADPSCCDFCQMLDGVTSRVEPQPLHNNCGCTSTQIYRSDSGSPDISSLAPGDEIDQVKIQEHGELGPVITDKNYNFTGPDDLQD
jgi:hypothetical protein